MKKAAPILITFCLLLVLMGTNASAQYKVKGTVYDSSRIYRIEAVTVQTTSGRHTITDTMGRYEVDVTEKDSIWFSYLGKPTPKYAVLKMADVSRFDIALRLASNVMQEVRIKNRSYKMDSIQNRKDYAKIFNYEKVSAGSMTSIGPMGAGIDIQELIRLFQFRKNKATLKFQARLMEQEREKFVSHRFSKGLVIRITGLEGEALDNFMALYRPDYEFTAAATDYMFHMYIKVACQKYLSLKKSF
ncbi:MAG: hypothetical protein ACXWV0_05535 [Flavisolibacter sp.]